MATFGDRLRFRRNRLGWTQDDLASKTGFSVSSITGWERGINPPNAQSLTKLAEVLACDVGWLLQGVTQQAIEKASEPFREKGSAYGEDHISPPWIRDLIARLCSMSPAFREKAVRQFHLTLDQMISAKSESYHGPGSFGSVHEDADELLSGIDPEVAETLRAGVLTANQIAVAQAAGRDEATTSGTPEPRPKSGPAISRQSAPAKPSPMKTS